MNKKDIFNLFISNIKQFQVIKDWPWYFVYCEAMHCVRWWFFALYKWKFGVKFGICTLHWCLSKESIEGKSWLIFTLLPAPHRESSTRWTSPCCPCFPLLVTFLPSSSTCPCCLKDQYWLFLFTVKCVLTNWVWTGFASLWTVAQLDGKLSDELSEKIKFIGVSVVTLFVCLVKS